MRSMQKRLVALIAAACLLLSGPAGSTFAEEPAAAPTQNVTPAPTTVQPPAPAPTTVQTSAPEPTAAQETATETPAQNDAPASPELKSSAAPTSAATTDTSTTPTSAPTTDASAAPTSAPTADTSAAPTSAATTDTSAAPTSAPTTDTSAAPTTGTETPTPTPGAEGSPSPDPDATPTPTPTAGETTPAPAGEGSAWYWDGEQKRYGKLEELLLLTEETIYIASDELFTLTGEAAQRAQEADIALDPERFPEGEGYVLWLSDIGPGGEAEEGALYLWAGKEEDAPPEPTASAEPGPTDPAEVEAELLVVPEMYRAGAWSATAPSFTLTAVPDTLEGYTFAVSVDDGEAQAVESPCIFATEGQHTLVFYLIDASGAQAARSTTYTVWLDMAAPEAQAQFDMQTGMLTVTATDAMSGVDAISLDGGKTWQPMTAAEDGSFVYSAPLTAQVAAGDLMVRDATGNCWQSAETYGMPGGMGGNFGGMGGSFGGSFGGGGGSSGTTRTVSHSSGSEEEATAYGAVALEVEEGSMFVLTLGGETLPLTLALDYEAGGVEDTATTFTAELAVWNGTGEDEDYDTLILTARDDGAESPYAYRWDFSGDVYKTLFNSGVQYLVLRVGDRVTALSTAGFTAGTAYNALKSEGAASSEFAYSLWMGEPDPALEMEVEARGTRYLLDAGEGDMYYYDVYTGDMDMLSAAFGATQQEEQ